MDTVTDGATMGMAWKCDTLGTARRMNEELDSKYANMESEFKMLLIFAQL